MTRIIYDTSEDARIREIARLREKALHDEASMMRQATEKGIAIGEKRGKEQGIAIGEKKGIAIGEKKGRTEERNSIIEKLKASGMTDEQIKEILS